MKGISPLIAAVMLIAITVAIGAFVSGWFSSFTRTTTDKVSNKTSDAIDCSAASINIQDVYITAGVAGSANVIVKNSGFADNMMIINAQIFNKTGGNFSASGLPLKGFDKGSIVALNFRNISVVSCPSDFSQVIVSTNCGGISDTYDGAPKC